MVWLDQSTPRWPLIKIIYYYLIKLLPYNILLVYQILSIIPIILDTYLSKSFINVYPR